MKMPAKTYLSLGLCLFLVFVACSIWPSVFGFLTLFVDALIPFALGAAIAYVGNILMSFYERHYFPSRQTGFAAKSRRPVCLAGACLTVVLLLIAVVWVVVPQFVACLQTLIQQAPAAVERLLSTPWVAENLPQTWLDQVSSFDWAAQLPRILGLLQTGAVGAADRMQGVFTALFSGVTTWAIAGIFALNILAQKERLGRQVHRLTKRFLRPRWRERLYGGLRRLDASFHRYIVGQCTEAVILGSLCALGMLVFGLPYAGMVGVLVGVFALVPLVGAYVGAVVGAFMVLSVSPWQALLFLVFFLVLQQLEANLLYPRVVGASVGLPGIWVRW